MSGNRHLTEQSISEILQIDLAGVPQGSYGTEHAAHLLAQYQLYVEMTDRISQRRQTANTFFLTINTALVAILGLTDPGGVEWRESVWFAIIGAAGIVLSFSWYRLLRSYRDLNSAKFQIVHEIEQRLPVRPYDAEWKAIGEGKKSRLYLPFTHIETKIPWVFALLYIALAISSFIL